MNKVVTIVGPTACGKTKLAIELAERFDGEIVSADSMQVYKGMDIGTAKASSEERERVRHHLIDVVSPDEAYTAGQYQHDAFAALEDICRRGKLPIVCGGSGLYVNALTHDLDFSVPADPDYRKELERLDPQEAFARLEAKDPQAAARIHPNNVKRVLRALEIAERGPKREYDFDRPSNAYDYVLIGLHPERTSLYDAIDRRVDCMMGQGLLAEVQSLIDAYGTQANSFRQAIGYKEIISYLQGETDSLQAAVTQIKTNTRHFAKRQRTWFARDGRIRWFSSPDDPQIITHLESTIGKQH